MKTCMLLGILWIMGMSDSASQAFDARVYERIDTIITFDPQTLIEEIRIVKVNAVYMDTEFCEPLPKSFIAKRAKADLEQVKKLSAIEFRCSGMYQREWAEEWKIQSFDLVIYKLNQATKTISNWGSDFSEETRKGLAGLDSGDLVSFEQVILVHPQKGLITGGCSLLVE